MRTFLNVDVHVDEEDGLCVVWVHGSPWHRFAASNRLDRRIVGVSLVLAGLAKCAQIERGLGLNHDTLYKDKKRVAEGGIPALAGLKVGPKGASKVTPALRTRAKRGWCAGFSKREIAKRLGVSRETVRRMLKGIPGPAPEPSQLSLLDEPELAVAGEEVVVVATTSAVEDEHAEEAGTAKEKKENAAAVPVAKNTAGSEDSPAFLPPVPHRENTTQRDLDRTTERVLARFGLISEAEVRFVSGDNLRSVGALLILPPLVSLGFFQGLQAVYGGLKNGFYGLRHTVMTTVLMLTLRIKRAEQLAGAPPAALGRLLGLDRVPEVKTLRRRLREIADQGKANEFMRWFARHLAEADPDAVGFLYVDGHTRVYHGKRKVSKAYSTRKRLALPAATDFWVHDTSGQPFFVVTGEVSQSLTQQLLPIIEELESGEIVPKGKRVTFLFDRGGWSPELFKKIVHAGHDFVTYRKGKCARYPVSDFVEHSLEINGRQLSYMLRDGVARFGVGMQFRQVVRREPDGYQIAIVTSRNDLAAAEVVFRLSERWRQENYFKYARDEFALDALDSYKVEPEDPKRTVPNPKRRPLSKAIGALREEVAKLEADLGRAADANEESQRPTVRGFKIAHGKVRQELAKVRKKIETLVARRRQLPQRVTIAEASADQGVLLEVEHKHFMNAVKMAVYRAETSLLRMLDPHHRRNEDEGRKLLREAFQSSGSLKVVDGELRVTLNPLSAPRRTRAISALCDELSAAQVRVPGTTLRLKFGVSRETGVSELAMGPCQDAQGLARGRFLLQEVHGGPRPQARLQGLQDSVHDPEPQPPREAGQEAQVLARGRLLQQEVHAGARGRDAQGDPQAQEEEARGAGNRSPLPTAAKGTPSQYRRATSGSSCFVPPATGDSSSESRRGVRTWVRAPLPGTPTTHQSSGASSATVQ
ncbi:MAG: helix-turn-helix domain-containing protein [Planctomycetes bacterium]|nr:helix-turn-helix domain-containing protein [Planctomycetota bacterium]